MDQGKKLSFGLETFFKLWTHASGLGTSGERKWRVVDARHSHCGALAIEFWVASGDDDVGEVGGECGNVDVGMQINLESCFGLISLWFGEEYENTVFR
jgi:hypothetical protein